MSAAAKSPPLVFFRCEDMKATLTTRTCVAQYKAANGGETTKKQAGYTPHAKRLGCMGCPIGKAHSKGTPTPPELLVDAPTVRVERIALPMKVCSGCLKPFTPLDKKQRHCSTAQAGEGGDGAPPEGLALVLQGADTARGHCRRRRTLDGGTHPRRERLHGHREHAHASRPPADHRGARMSDADLAPVRRWCA